MGEAAPFERPKALRTQPPDLACAPIGCVTWYDCGVRRDSTTVRNRPAALVPRTGVSRGLTAADRLGGPSGSLLHAESTGRAEEGRHERSQARLELDRGDWWSRLWRPLWVLPALVALGSTALGAWLRMWASGWRPGSPRRFKEGRPTLDSCSARSPAR
jgi:hypothetical protein